LSFRYVVLEQTVCNWVRHF